MLTELFILGAGGHGRVVFEAAGLAWPAARIGVWDQAGAPIGWPFGGVSVRCFAGFDELPAAGHIAIGDNAARERNFALATNAGRHLVSVIHPLAIVSAHSRIAAGVFIAAGAILAANAAVADGAIVNHAAVVDHDCRIGAYAHVAPHATLGGDVEIGARCLVGASATVLPGLCIGEGAVIGAGAVVTRNVAAGAVLRGNPARPA
jgi:sugar O-acyltransferase (sialic acid O-acetyltransferase NeuD family)